MQQKNKTRYTKIVATIGPASCSPEVLRAMLKAGLNVARLNFSHGDHKSHGEMIKLIRKIAREEDYPVAILQDLGGPKIRLGKIKDLELKTGEKVKLFPGKETKEDSDLPVNYEYLLEDVNKGAQILLADGTVELLVIAKEKDHLLAEVLVGGLLSSHKGVNLPTSDLRVKSFTEKDREDLAFGLKVGVDFVAQSFVRHEEDLKPINDMIATSEKKPLLIAKIEKPQALKRISEILLKVDGLMVARGDLGVEMPIEEVPMIQKKLIQEARHRGKVVITATQMLGSMVMNPRPSRAEVTDVANAVLDGTDAVMLSDETAVGKYPEESVKVLHKVASQAEPHIETSRFISEKASEYLSFLGYGLTRAAAILAHDLKVSAIVAATHSGSTARLMSIFRPHIPIIALTSNLDTYLQLSLSWGVTPVLVKVCQSVEELESEANKYLLEKEIVKKGDLVVMTCGLPLQTAGATNLIRILEIGSKLGEGPISYPSIM